MPAEVARQPAPAGRLEFLIDTLQRMESILDNSSAVIYIKDAASRYLFINRRYEETFGVEKAKLIGRTQYDIFPKEVADAVEANNRRVLQTGCTLEVEETVPQSDGPHTYLSAKFPLLDIDGKPYAVFGISTDITPRKQAEAELRRHREQLRELVDERTAELLAVNRRLAAFSSLAGRLNSINTLEDAARLIVQVADELIGWDACLLAVYRPDGAARRILTIDTIAGQRAEIPDTRDAPPPGPITGQVLQQGAKLILRDPAAPVGEQGPDLVPFGDTARRSQSLMFVPIRHGTHPVGMLTIQSYTPQAYTPRDLETLQALADHCGGAVERTRSEERLRAFLTLAHRLNATSSMDQAARLVVGVADELLGWDACFLVECAPEDDSIRRVLSIDQVDGQRMDVSFAYSGPRPHTMVRRVMTEGAKLILRESEPPAEPARQESRPPELGRFGDTQRPSASLMFVPIRNGTQVIGVLSIQSYKPQAYTPADLATLQALADHCGGAMERIRAEEAQRRTQHDYQALVNTIDGIVWEADTRTSRLTFVSRSAEPLLGYPLADWYVEPAFWQDHVHPDDRARVIALYRRATQERRDYHFEYRMLAADGRTLWLRDVVSVVVENDEVVKLRGVMVDITDRKQAEEALRESEEKWRSLVENAPDFILSLDPEGRIQFINRLVPPFTMQQVIGSSAYDYVPPEYHPLLREKFAHVLSTGGPASYEVPAPGSDGRLAWYKCQVGPIWHEGRVAGLTVLATDFTEHRRAVEALRESEELNRRIIETMMGGIVQVGVDGSILRANAHAQRILGLSHDELTRRSVRDFTSQTIWEDGTPCPLEEYPVSRCLSTGQPQAGATIGVRRTDGRIVWAVYSAVPLRDPVTEQLTGAVVSFLDITERKQMEEHLHRSQKLEAVGVLAAGVAHDFNNMLMVIIGNCELALKGLRDTKRQLLLREIMKAADRAHQLTRQLLALGRQPQSAPEPLDLNAMFAGMTGMLHGILGSEVRVVIEPDPQVPSVRADRNQLERAVVNLAINARDAMPNGGTLTLHIAQVSAAADELRRLPKGAPPALRAGCVRLSFADSGPGLAPEVEKHLYEPFFTTKPVGKGTGLGLALVHSFVQQCGGYIAHESRPGKGTTFHVYLPLAAGGAP
ncbi:MAG TPA: PAS domain S-box protein [Phycisphaerae bacterium]